MRVGVAAVVEIGGDAERPRSRRQGGFGVGGDDEADRIVEESDHLGRRRLELGAGDHRQRRLRAKQAAKRQAIRTVGRGWALV
jgi:hypothetical protein